MSRLGRRLLAAATLALSVGCGAGVDHGATEVEVARDIETRTGLTGVEVRCPAVPALAPGREVECTVSTPELTGTVPTRLVVGDGEAHRWVMQERIFNTQAVEPQILNSPKIPEVFGAGAQAVSCDRFAKRVVDYKFACMVRLDSGVNRSLLVTVVDAETPVVEWQTG